MSHTARTAQVRSEFPSVSYYEAEMIAFDRAAEEGDYSDSL